jgi:hypothetical protein
MAERTLLLRSQNGRLSDKGEPFMPRQSAHAIASMRQLLPSMLQLLTSPVVHDQLRIQGEVINWDAVNDIERECGMPETPCPDSDVTLRLGLDENAADR